MAKIAIIKPFRFVPPVNGGQKASFYFAKHLSTRIKTYCLSTTNNPEYNESFHLVKLFRDEKTKYLNPFVGFKIYNWCKSEKITHLFLNQPFMGIQIYIISKVLKIPLFIYVHNLEFQRFRGIGKWWSKLLFYLERWLYPKADALFFISEDEKNDAPNVFNIKPDKCHSLPYGTELGKAPNVAENRMNLRKQLHISEDLFLIIYFAPMNYPPNLNGLDNILDKINPILKEKATFDYKILVCGGGLPEGYNRLHGYADKNIKYLGFVDDIKAYVQASDAMINPIILGGGVKIKVMETLAWGITVISSQSGSKGIDKEACGDKLQVVEDTDWEAYVSKIIGAYEKGSVPSPGSFYKRYNWKNIINKFISDAQL